MASEHAGPTSIAAYQLLDEIGRGGMGVVHRARDLRLHREVAIKLLLADGPGDTLAAARFRAEAHITGQLQHPGIPAVHELGILPDGRPFLAMKLVQGRTFQDLLKDRPDPGHDRGRFLAVFEQLCQAVGYAHAHGVIHRDLKPGNVMVGAFGEVQVMDWGLAKRLVSGGQPEPTAEEAPAVTVTDMPHNAPADEAPEVTGVYTPIDTPGADGSATRTGSVLGTPAYMPPEQAGGEIRKLDARSDVFGLGAILCQVLTGRPPYSGGNVNELRIRAVRGDMADALAALDSSGAEPALVALCKQCLAIRQDERPTDGSTVARQVAGIRQAAEERARRAETERAQSLVREGEQRKRRRVVQWAGGAVAAVLLLGIVGTTIGLVQANAAADAERRANETTKKRLAQIEKGVELFAGLLTELNPRNEEQGAPPLYEQLRERAAKAADELVGEAVGDPEAVARLQSLLGRTLFDLGDRAKAAEVLERARATQEAKLGADHEDTLATLKNLAEAYRFTGKLPEAIALNEQVRNAFVKKLGADHLETLKRMHNLALTYQHAGRLPEAIALSEQVSNAFVKKLGADHSVTLSALHCLAGSYLDARKLPEAITLFEQVRDGRVEKLGSDHPDTLDALHNLAKAYHAAGTLPKAIALFEQVRAAREKKLGAGHSATLQTMHNLAKAYQASDRLPDAIALLQQVRDAQVKTLGADHPDTLWTMHYLARAYQAAGRLPEAIDLYKQVRDAQVKKPGPDHPDTLSTLNSLASAYQADGRLPEAIPLYEQVRDAQVKKLGADHPDTLWTMYSLAWAYQFTGNGPEAIALYAQAAAGIERGRFQHKKTGDIIIATVRAYEQAKQFDKAEAWRRKWLAVVKERAGADSPEYADNLSVLGATLLQQKNWTEAETALKECLAICEKTQPDHWQTFNTRSRLGGALLGQKKYADAESLLVAGYEGLKQREKMILPQFKFNLTLAVERLVQLYEAMDKKDEAAKWRKELDGRKGPPNEP